MAIRNIQFDFENTDKDMLRGALIDSEYDENEEMNKNF
jgi:hypothetical protein